MPSTADQDFLSHVKKVFLPFKAGVKRRAQGKIPYDYLVPAGYYEEQWDWDGFFIGLALSHEIPSEAIFLKNWTLNFLQNADSRGFTAGCVTPKGPEGGHRSFPMKPFLAQGAFFASTFLKDFSWLKGNFDKLATVALYRERHAWNNKYDLGVWNNSMESGADNNLAVLDFPNKTVIATDLNSFMYREFKALSLIAKELGRKKDEEFYKKRAEKIKKGINDLLWNKEDGAYYNLDSRKGEHIKCIGYSSIHPLWTGLAIETRAKTFINRYVLNPKKLWSAYGIRSLSKDNPGYNNDNIITPYSNWQGPIWPIVNFFFVYALIRYGYQKEAIDVAKKIAKLCLNDIQKTGGMHENYDAETGRPLAAPNFISWNLLVPIYLNDALNNSVSFSL
jgi:alpha,alpha-trehalase